MDNRMTFPAPRRRRRRAIAPRTGGWPRSIALLAVTFAGTSLAPNSARAQAQEQTDATRAELLFDEGRALMGAKQFSAACAKFAASEALDPGGGTVLNLGICREREGRTATAFETLTEALALARADGRSDRIATAEKHLAALNPELSHLTVQLAVGLGQSLTIELDGAPLEPARIGQPIALDPGVHRLHAAQAGHEAWKGEVTLGPIADTQTITVPSLRPGEPVAVPPVVPVVPLAALPMPSRANPTRRPEQAENRPPNPIGIGLVSVGAVALTGGTYFGVRALVLRARSNSDYDSDTQSCRHSGCQDDWAQAKTSAVLSDIGLGVGVVALAVGGYLILRPKPKTHDGMALVLSVGASNSDARALLKGEF
jgi:serine/threonine-protein kinase